MGAGATLPTASGRRRSACAASLSGKSLTPDFYRAHCGGIYTHKRVVASPEQGRKGQEVHDRLVMNVPDTHRLLYDFLHDKMVRFPDSGPEPGAEETVAGRDVVSIFVSSCRNFETKGNNGVVPRRDNPSVGLALHGVEYVVGYLRMV